MWNGYTEKVVSEEIVKHGKISFKFSECYIIGDKIPISKIQIIKDLVKKLGFRIITQEDAELDILRRLKIDSWGDNNPLNKCIELNNPKDIIELFRSYGKDVNIEILGSEFTKKLIETFVTNRPEEWQNDENSYRVPCIPNGMISLNLTRLTTIQPSSKKWTFCQT